VGGIESAKEALVNFWATDPAESGIYIYVYFPIFPAFFSSLYNIFLSPILLTFSHIVVNESLISGLVQRMQNCGTYSAEDSCFIKYQAQDDGDVVPRGNDVEKVQIKIEDSPIAGRSANETNNPSSLNEKGIFQNAPRQDSDTSSLAPSLAHDDKDDFPEGGLKGWSVVIGSFCGSFSVFGIINSTAILLEYFSSHQLKDYTPSQIGWIFGLSLFLTFFCGAPIGPIFDAYGPRALIFCGSILLIASMFLLGLCTRM
jgi:hypothetical protein